MIAGATNSPPSTSRRSRMKRSRDAGFSLTPSAMATIGAPASMPTDAFAALVEVAQRAGTHRIGMPLAGPDAFVGDMRRGKLRGDDLRRIAALDRSVDDPLRSEIFGALHAERELRECAAVHHFTRQEIL